MPKARFSIAHNDEGMLTLVQATDQKTLAIWAIDCAERVLPFFEEQFPHRASYMRPSWVLHPRPPSQISRNQVKNRAE